MSSFKNSTSVALLANEEFTGVWEELGKYQTINILLKTDQRGLLIVEHASVQNSPDFSDAYPINAGFGESINVSTRGRFFRVRFINGSTNQTYLRLACHLSLHPESMRMEASKGTRKIFDGSIVNDPVYSEAVDISRHKLISLMGSCNNTCNLRVQASHDGTSFYDTDILLTLNNSQYYTTFESSDMFIRVKITGTGNLLTHLNFSN